MAICKFCNQENAPGAITCAHCGANIETSNDVTTGEKPSALLKVVSFLFPLVGLILYLVKRNENRTAAKAYGKMALISFILGVVFSVVLTIAMVAATVGFVGKKAEQGNIALGYDTNVADGVTNENGVITIKDGVDNQFTIDFDGAEDGGISVELDDVEDSSSASDDTNINDTTEEFVVPAINQ